MSDYLNCSRCGKNIIHTDSFTWHIGYNDVNGDYCILGDYCSKECFIEVIKGIIKDEVK